MEKTNGMDWTGPCFDSLLDNISRVIYACLMKLKSMVYDCFFTLIFR